MIQLVNLCKTYVWNGQRKRVADHITTTFPSKTTVALLGRNGAGKSSLLRMIAGTMKPDSGKILSTGSISWPVGFAGSFHPDLTGLQNVRFIARIYGVDSDGLVDAVCGFAGLGSHFNQPLRSYSSGMRSRLAFGVSMAIDFDTYLVDEVMSVGDAEFKESSLQILKDRMARRAAIVVSHSIPMIKELCEHGAVIENGRMSYFKDIDEAIRYHLTTLNSPT